MGYNETRGEDIAGKTLATLIAAPLLSFAHVFHLNKRFVRVKLCQPGWVLHGIAANISYTDWRIMLNLSDPTHEFIDGASEIHAHRITLSRTYMGLGGHRYMQKKKKKSLHGSRILILSIIAKFANVVGQSPGGMWQLYKTGFCLFIFLFSSSSIHTQNSAQAMLSKAQYENLSCINSGSISHIRQILPTYSYLNGCQHPLLETKEPLKVVMLFRCSGRRG